MMKVDFKKDLLPHIVSILVLLLFSVALFYPSINGSKILGPDGISAKARYKYMNDYQERTGEVVRWNPSQFSGDPRVMKIGKEFNLLNLVHTAFTLDVMVPIGMFFSIGIAFYLALCLMGVNKWLSLTLSMAYMLSYIFFTLFEAGHGQKILTLTYCPLIISGTICLLGNRKLNGIVALLIGTSLSIYVGHVQMVYYLILALVAFGLPLIIFALIDKEIKSFFAGLGIAVFVALLALGTDYAQVKSTLDFSKQTMRAGSILAPPVEETVEPSEKESGLKWDYAMSWSYKTKEFFNIIVPYISGGGSQEKVAKENPIAKLMMQNGSPVKNGKVTIPGYWGDMPFTSGGGYIGASITFLFILSLFFINRKYTIAFLSALFMIYLLSLGKHAEWFNRILFDHLPMFSKFRAPSSIISILPAFVFIAVGMGVNELFNKENAKVQLKNVAIAGGVSIGLLLVILAVGLTSFDFLSPKDVEYPFNIQTILIDGRKSLFQADVIRGIGFMAIAAAFVGLYLKELIKSKYLFLTALALIFVLDMLPIGKRLISNDDYVSKKSFEQEFTARPADRQIANAEPKGRGYYRVLDLSVNTFNDAKSCYHHNQIGGYSAIKTQRYQDLIEYHIAKNNMQVLNMLNGKYFITREGAVQQNPNANGNAWFVNNIQYVNTNLEEIEALNDVNTQETAVVKQDEFDGLNVGDGNGKIELTFFSPDKMVYSSNSTSNQLAVFSETWYNGKTGWEATIDGEEATIVRANYILRAIEIPSGTHEIVMEFKPKATGSFVSLASSSIAWLLIIGIVLIQFGVIQKPQIIEKIENEQTPAV